MCIRDHFSSLLGPYGTISHGPFFPDFSEKRGRAQRPSVWSVTRGSASEQWSPKRPGDAHLAVSIRNHWRQLRRGWSPVPAIGLFYSARTASSPSPACQALDKKSWWEAKSLLASVVLAHRGWLRLSILTTDRFVFGMRAHRRSMFTNLFWYESISTVDFDHFLSEINRNKPPRPKRVQIDGLGGWKYKRSKISLLRVANPKAEALPCGFWPDVFPGRILAECLVSPLSWDAYLF